MSFFKVLSQSGSARRGELHTPHGTIQTPVFMPVGTYGAVKSVAPEELKAAGSQIILGNTYHLYLRPGLDLLQQFGGLHRWMGWDRPILTDSGGFQVFSLAKSVQLLQNGVRFRSHLNGDEIFLTPQLAAQIQRTIGSDIAMVLDHCPALPSTPALLNEAVERSARWAGVFLREPKKEGQAIFGICQGGTNLELRRKSLELTCALPIDGIAVGGLSVGEPHEEMVATLEGIQPHLPPSLPHYLMGVGTPLDLLEAIHNGIDMFDCVLPTRNGRNGGLFTHDGLLNIRNQQYRLADEPIDPECHCPACTQFSRSYLRHLFITKEILGCRLATLHNLHYYHRFIAMARHAIDQKSAKGGWADFYSQMRPRLKAGYGKGVLADEHNEPNETL